MLLQNVDNYRNCMINASNIYKKQLKKKKKKCYLLKITTDHL